MPQSTLSLKKSDYDAETALFLGYGRGPLFGDTAWTRQQLAAIDSCVKSGVRKFYFPPPVEGVPQAYEWSFLRPVGTLAIASGSQTVDLPDDFGGFDGPPVLADSDRQAVPILVTSVVRQKYYELPDATGQPELVEVEPVKHTDAGRGQRYRLRIWPQADADYTLQFRYVVVPDALTGDRPYVYGGPEHHETVLEACLSVAEARLDDALGVHEQLFKERLAASVGLDRRFKPQLLGYNGDRSDWNGRYGRGDRHGWGGGVTSNGVQY